MARLLAILAGLVNIAVWLIDRWKERQTLAILSAARTAADVKSREIADAIDSAVAAARLPELDERLRRHRRD